MPAHCHAQYGNLLSNTRLYDRLMQLSVISSTIRSMAEHIVHSLYSIYDVHDINSIDRINYDCMIMNDRVIVQNV